MEYPPEAVSIRGRLFLGVALGPDAPCSLVEFQRFMAKGKAFTARAKRGAIGAPLQSSEMGYSTQPCSL
ncbi:hypothetical protein D1820_04065 [Phaeobacter sp. LSS9]|nr:hypothetical protein D1820_04065 [Phaeobacter sp. LSS9]